MTAPFTRPVDDRYFEDCVTGSVHEFGWIAVDERDAIEFARLSHVASLASPGVDELRWTQPVRPGDTLSVRATVLEARRSRSRPDRGIVCTLFEVLNLRGEVVMSAKAMNMLEAREPQSV